MTTKEQLLERMGMQLSSPVQWIRDVQTAVSCGCNTFVEIGPKPVLSSFVKSIQKNLNVQAVCKLGIYTFAAVIFFNV